MRGKYLPKMEEPKGIKMEDEDEDLLNDETFGIGDVGDDWTPPEAVKDFEYLRTVYHSKGDVDTTPSSNQNAMAANKLKKLIGVGLNPNFVKVETKKEKSDAASPLISMQNPLPPPPKEMKNEISSYEDDISSMHGASRITSRLNMMMSLRTLNKPTKYEVMNLKENREEGVMISSHDMLNEMKRSNNNKLVSPMMMDDEYMGIEYNDRDEMTSMMKETSIRGSSIHPTDGVLNRVDKECVYDMIDEEEDDVDDRVVMTTPPMRYNEGMLGKSPLVGYTNNMIGDTIVSSTLVDSRSSQREETELLLASDGREGVHQMNDSKSMSVLQPTHNRRHRMGMQSENLKRLQVPQKSEYTYKNMLNDNNTTTKQSSPSNYVPPFTALHREILMHGTAEESVYKSALKWFEVDKREGMNHRGLMTSRELDAILRIQFSQMSEHPLMLSKFPWKRRQRRSDKHGEEVTLTTMGLNQKSTGADAFFHVAVMKADSRFSRMHQLMFEAVGGKEEERGDGSAKKREGNTKFGKLTYCTLRQPRNMIDTVGLISDKPNADADVVREIVEDRIDERTIGLLLRNIIEDAYELFSVIEALKDEIETFPFSEGSELDAMNKKHKQAMVELYDITTFRKASEETGIVQLPVESGHSIRDWSVDGHLTRPPPLTASPAASHELMYHNKSNWWIMRGILSLNKGRLLYARCLYVFPNIYGGIILQGICGSPTVLYDMISSTTTLQHSETCVEWLMELEFIHERLDRLQNGEEAFSHPFDAQDDSNQLSQLYAENAWSRLYVLILYAIGKLNCRKDGKTQFLAAIEHLICSHTVEDIQHLMQYNSGIYVLTICYKKMASLLTNHFYHKELMSAYLNLVATALVLYVTHPSTSTTSLIELDAHKCRSVFILLQNIFSVVKELPYFTTDLRDIIIHALGDEEAIQFFQKLSAQFGSSLL